MAEGEVEVPDEPPGWLVMREWLVVMRKLALRRSGYLTSGSSTITRICYVGSEREGSDLSVLTRS